MPLIRLTQEALERGKVPEIGWSHGTLNDVTEFKAASGSSVNYLFEFIIDQGPEKGETNKGRYINAFFNSKALGGDGSKGVPDVIDRFALMVSALIGVSRAQLKGDDYDTDHLKGKSCWLKVEALPDQNGKLTTAITDYSTSLDVPF